MFGYIPGIPVSRPWRWPRLCLSPTESSVWCVIVAPLSGSPNAALGNKEGSLLFRQMCLLATQLTLRDANPSFNLTFGYGTTSHLATKKSCNLGFMNLGRMPPQVQCQWIILKASTEKNNTQGRVLEGQVLHLLFMPLGQIGSIGNGVPQHNCTVIKRPFAEFCFEALLLTQKCWWTIRPCKI